MIPPSVQDAWSSDTLMERLEAGELALLPTTRAARSLRQVFDAHQRAEDKQAWQSPHILSWSNWTASLWSELIVSGADSRLLLNAAQEHSLWSEVIRELAPEGTLEQTLAPLIKLAHSGYALGAAFECLARLRSTAMTHDHRTFALWAQVFGQRCEQNGCLSSALLERMLRQHLDQVGSAKPTVPAALLLVNWPEFTPAQCHLLDAFGKRGTRIENVVTPSSYSFSRYSVASRRSPFRTLTVAADEREELLCAARWIRAQIEKAAHVKTGPAPFRIGVLLPGVSVPELEPVFREVLAPELQAVTMDSSSAPWEFSRSEPLNAVPLVATALDIAGFCTQPLPLHTVSKLLLSPYLGVEADKEPNARFDAYVLRRSLRLRPEITLRNLASIASAAARNGASPPPAPWLGPLNEFAGKALDPKLRRSYSEWMEVLRRLAATAGWPGSRVLSARELAANRAWESTLDLVATLDFSGERVSFPTALGAVERQVRETALDSPSTGAPATVLTVNEAAGCVFDAVVLLRGTEDHWPPFRRPHSLLSLGLQKELGMPGTDPARERRLLEALLAASGTALATCAEANADGPLRPAPMFRELGFEQVPASRLVPAPPKLFAVTEDLVLDDTPLPPLPSPQVRSGARVLQLQAACGFRAFAEVRLSATEPDTRSAGFDPRESGNLLHRTMEHFWKRVNSQSVLRAMSFQQRNDVLSECIDEAVSPMLSLDIAWDRAYLALQKERLRRLLHQWINSELRRTPFTVAALEQDQRIQVGPLNLRVRIDRMDQVDNPNGQETTDGLDPAGKGLVLVDYKSGFAADPRDWLGERPDQPQVPLYALLLSPGELKGVAFAHIRSGKMKYAGLESEAGLLGMSRSAAPETDLDRQTEEWRSALDALAQEFSEGVSEVRPKDGIQTCRYCAQRLLCRLDPATLEVRENAEGEAAESPVEEVYG